MDLRKIIEAAKDQGWEHGRNAKGHHVFAPADPTKPKVVFSGTPSDVRAVRNLVAQLRRSGLQWPPPSKKARRSQARREREREE